MDRMSRACSSIHLQKVKNPIIEAGFKIPSSLKISPSFPTSTSTLMEENLKPSLIERPQPPAQSTPFSLDKTLKPFTPDSSFFSLEDIPEISERIYVPLSPPVTLNFKDISESAHNSLVDKFENTPTILNPNQKDPVNSNSPPFHGFSTLVSGTNYQDF